MVVTLLPAAWADPAIFANGRWLFDSLPEAQRSMHYVGGGQFFVTGPGLKLGNPA